MPADCAASIAPKGEVEPVCQESRCAMAPAGRPFRACQADAQCTVAQVGCDLGAVRRDKVRDLAVRNDHHRCEESAGELAPGAQRPAAACLRGVLTIEDDSFAWFDPGVHSAQKARQRRMW